MRRNPCFPSTPRLTDLRAPPSEYFNDNPAADAFGKVRGQLDDVKGVMVENIGVCASPHSPRRMLHPHPFPAPSSALQRRCFNEARRSSCWWTRRSSSRSLRASFRGSPRHSRTSCGACARGIGCPWLAAVRFNRRAVLCAFRCKNVKMWAMIACVLLVIAWLIASLVCGFDFSKCGAK